MNNMNAFNPFLAIACIHRDMRAKMDGYLRLSTAELEDENFEAVASLQQEQLRYVAAAHQLLESIDAFIAAEDEHDIELLRAQAEVLLSITVKEVAF